MRHPYYNELRHCSRSVYRNELIHYGVTGMKWGVRRGPPYPLSKQTGAKTVPGSAEWINRNERREKEAADYYERVRHSDDVDAIAESSGMSAQETQQIKGHIFDDEHQLYEGLGRLDPDYDMAVAWKRLTDGRPEHRDILLLKHELLESTLEKENEWSLDRAHSEAKKKYDWEKVIEDELGEDGEADGLL